MICWVRGGGDGGEGCAGWQTYFYFKNSEAPHFSISDRMYGYINLYLNDAQAH